MNNILETIKKRIILEAPKAKVYLYGSRAIGNEKNTSDWDVLILLDQEKITDEIEQKITSPLYDLEFDTGEIISPLIYSEKEWHTKYSITPFYKNVMQECKLL